MTRPARITGMAKNERKKTRSPGGTCGADALMQIAISVKTSTDRIFSAMPRKRVHRSAARGRRRHGGLRARPAGRGGGGEAGAVVGQRQRLVGMGERPARRSRRRSGRSGRVRRRRARPAPSAAEGPTSTIPAVSRRSGPKASSIRSSTGSVGNRNRGIARRLAAALGAGPVGQQPLLRGDYPDRRAGIVDARRQRPRGDLGEHREAEARILLEGAFRPEGEGVADGTRPLPPRPASRSWRAAGRTDERARQRGDEDASAACFATSCSAERSRWWT